MGIFARFRKGFNSMPLDGGSTTRSSSSTPSSPSSMFEYADSASNYLYMETTISLSEQPPEVHTQLYFVVSFLIAFLTIRFVSFRQLQPVSGEYTLNTHYLDDVRLFKEVFLAYLNAALLEPVLAIGTMDDVVVGIHLLTNIAELLSIGWWIWLLTDAFDFTDVMQYYKFHVEFGEEIGKDRAKYSWLRLHDGKSQSHRRELLGSIKRDVALWFMLGSIAAAWMPGPVAHREVLHAYVVVILWVILHHYARRATTWGNK
jgi:hypothetical protein